MRNSEFIKRLKRIFSFLNPNSAIPACRPRSRPRAGQAGALHIPRLAKFLSPQFALRIPHFSIGQQKILFVLALFIFALIYYKFYYRPASPPEETYQEVVVEILGEVQKPGIYIFKSPPTLIEAVEKAGSFKENISLDRGVSSEIMEAGTLINVIKETNIIPPYPPLEKGGAGGILEKRGSAGMTQNVIKIKLARMEARKLLAFSLPLDLNRVSVEDLCLIPGIGESLAKEIISYRERRKAFRSVEELKNVKGIEEKKYRSLVTFFTVRS